MVKIENFDDLYKAVEKITYLRDGGQLFISILEWDDSAINFFSPATKDDKIFDICLRCSDFYVRYWKSWKMCGKMVYSLYCEKDICCKYETELCRTEDPNKMFKLLKALIKMEIK